MAEETLDEKIARVLAQSKQFTDVRLTPPRQRGERRASAPASVQVEGGSSNAQPNLERSEEKVVAVAESKSAPPRSEPVSTVPPASVATGSHVADSELSAS